MGLLANQASVDTRLRHAADALGALPGVRLAALFGPEHGLRGEAQDMEATRSGTDPATGLPVHSLYGESAASLAPDGAMLEGLDVVVCDLPDIGTRYYTFAATLFLMMEQAAARGIQVVVADRPNPLGGRVMEGPGLADGFRSFVGPLDVPVRHGMTLGELARLFQAERRLDVDLEIVLAEGWDRGDDGAATGLPWVPPSPNMPTLDTARVYPGGCLVEGTNLSEGRGTTRPFEQVGAPWLDAPALADTMNRMRLPGLRLRPHWFRPVAQKWQGRTCAGVQVHMDEPHRVRSFAAYVALLAACRAQDPARFAWRTEPYEFESDRLAIDLLAGSPQLRADLEADRPLAEMERDWDTAVAAFARRRRPHLLYPEGA